MSRRELSAAIIEGWKRDGAQGVDMRKYIFAHEWETLCDLALKGLGIVPEAAASKPPEIRKNPDGTLDEVVASNAEVHLEQMDRDHWWLGVYSGGKRVSVWLKARTTVRASYEAEPQKVQS